MNFDLTEEQNMIREAVRDFAEREVKPVAIENDKNEHFPVDLAKKMGEMGLFGITVSPEYGGHGMDTLSYIIAVEELARVDGSTAATIAAHNSLGIGPINQFGTEEQKKKYLPQLCTGEGLWSFGLTEPSAGSDTQGTKTTAVRKDDKWVINGSKTFITNASTPISKGVNALAVTGERPDGKKEFTAFIVEKGAEGYTQRTIHDKLMWRSSDTAELFFENVCVGDENIIGQVGQGARIMLETLDSGRLSIAAMGLGCAQGAYELALAHAQERKQFGKPLCKFQAIAFKLADMATKIELARNLLYKACWLKEEHRPFSKEAAMSKLYCAEIAGEVANEAVQIFGGYGLLKDYNVERFFRDQRLLQIGEGTSEVQRIVISRQIGC